MKNETDICLRSMWRLRGGVSSTQSIVERSLGQFHSLCLSELNTLPLTGDLTLESVLSGHPAHPCMLKFPGQSMEGWEAEKKKKKGMSLKLTIPKNGIADASYRHAINSLTHGIERVSLLFENVRICFQNFQKSGRCPKSFRSIWS